MPPILRVWMTAKWGYGPLFGYQARWFDEASLEAVSGMGCFKSLELSVKWMEDYRVININGLHEFSI